VEQFPGRFQIPAVNDLTPRACRICWHSAQLSAKKISDGPLRVKLLPPPAIQVLAKTKIREAKPKTETVQ
jgi:hypothetical protein